jgi:hypothetical protein
VLCASEAVVDVGIAVIPAPSSAGAVIIPPIAFPLSLTIAEPSVVVVADAVPFPELDAEADIVV